MWVKSSSNAATVAAQARNFDVKYRYDACNGFAGTTDREGFAALSADPRVDYIVPDGPVQASLAQSRVLIQANLVETQMGLTGQGVGVAVLDTGINYNHPNLASQYAGGHDFINNDADPLDDNGHGSAVCGVIASTNATNRGIAPGAQLVAVKVLDATGFGLWSQIAAGLNWCVANKALYNIRVANMSIGVGGLRLDARDESRVRRPRARGLLQRRDPGRRQRRQRRLDLGNQLPRDLAVCDLGRGDLRCQPRLADERTRGRRHLHGYGDGRGQGLLLQQPHVVHDPDGPRQPHHDHCRLGLGVHRAGSARLSRLRTSQA